MVEPTDVGERSVERMLAAVAERRMAKIVRQAQGFGEVFIEPERACDCPADLRDFETVRQAHPEMIAVGRDEHLRLMPQPAKGDRVDDPVAVALEDVARTRQPGSPLRDRAGRATAPDARQRQWERSFCAEWHNLVGFGITPAGRVDADGTRDPRRKSARRSCPGTGQ